MAKLPAGGDLQPDTAAYYDAVADIYDELAKEGDWSAKVDRLMQRAFIFKHPDTVETTLDLGAGTGHSIDAIKRYANPSRVIAVDISPGMLEQLGKRYTAPVVEAVSASIEDYTADRQEKADLITAMSTLEFVPNLPRVLSGNIARLLNRGGIFAATYIPRGSGGEVERLLESPALGRALYEYYWPPEAIEDSLTSQGLAILDRADGLDAYQRDGEQVKYNFLVAGLM